MSKLSTAGSLSTTDSTVEMGTSNAAQVGVNVTGTWSGTITFEARRGSTWENAQVFTVAGVASTATTTVNVSRRIDTGGTNSVRARFSTATSGAPLIQFDGTEAGMGGSGGGGGASSIADGSDVAEGTTTDAGVVTDTTGTLIGFARGNIIKWVNYLTRIPAALTGSGNFKVAVVESTATVTAAGALTTNNAAPGATNVGVLPGIANAAAPSITEGRQALLSQDLSGRTRVTTETQTVNVAGTTAGGSAFVGPSVAVGFVGTGGTHRNMTAAPSVSSTTGTDIPGFGPMLKGTTNFFNQQGDDSGNAKIIGTKTHNAAVPSTNFSTLPALANAALPTYTETFEVKQSVDLRGQTRVVAAGLTTVLSATITRPADTTAYAAGDEMTDTGGTIRTITGAARYSGGSGIIQGIYVSQSTVWTTKPAMEIWIYDTTSTPVSDNGAFAPTDGVTDTAIAVIPVTATYAGTVNQALDSGQISVPFLTSGSANLFFRVVIRNAAQDSANSGTSLFRFRILQD